jgi:glycosyltransferase involved in cell wall biosynthesis
MTLRLLYPVTWSRLDRKADRAQSAATAAALARRGVAVTLLMPQRPGDPALSVDAFREWFAVKGDLRLVQRPGRGGESLLRQLFWLRRVFRDPEIAGADLLYARIPALLGMGARSPLPFAFDHYRPWPDDLPLIRPLVRRTARNSQCLGFILHSGYAAGAYRRAGVAEEKILVAHNGADLPAAPPDKPAGLPADRPIALYAGRINREKGLDQLLGLAALRPEVLFVLVGSEGEGAIEAQARAHANVRIIPWQAPAALPAWLAAADVLLIPSSRAPLERYRNCVLPLKLFSYLAAGRPILAPIAPDTAELLVDGDNALVVPPDAPAVAAVALDRILGEPGLAARLGGGASRTAAGLSWDARAAKIQEFLESRLRR